MATKKTWPQSAAVAIFFYCEIYGTSLTRLGFWTQPLEKRKPPHASNLWKQRGKTFPHPWVPPPLRNQAILKDDSNHLIPLRPCFLGLISLGAEWESPLRNSHGVDVDPRSYSTLSRKAAPNGIWHPWSSTHYVMAPCNRMWWRATRWFGMLSGRKKSFNLKNSPVGRTKRTQMEGVSEFEPVWKNAVGVLWWSSTFSPPFFENRIL